MLTAQLTANTSRHGTVTTLLCRPLNLTFYLASHSIWLCHTELLPLGAPDGPPHACLVDASTPDQIGHLLWCVSDSSHLCCRQTTACAPGTGQT